MLTTLRPILIEGGRDIISASIEPAGDELTLDAEVASG